jgi:hypothetical protein
MVFGLLVPGEARRQKLIELTLKAGLLTNPSVVGAAGCLTTAAFTAFAQEDVPVHEWANKLLGLFELAQNYLEQQPEKLLKDLSKKPEWDKLSQDWQHFMKKIGVDKRAIPPRDAFPPSKSARDILHKELETDIRKNAYPHLTNGDRGDTSVMLAFHGLLYGIRYLLEHFPGRENSSPSALRSLFNSLPPSQKAEIFDTVVHFTVIHGGDNDSTGSIALSLFGTIFGTSGAPEHQVNGTEIMPKAQKVAKIFTDYAEKLVIAK